MAQFDYSAINATGHQLNGSLSAPSREAALNILRSQNIKPLSVKESKPKRASFSLGSGVKSKDLVIFTRELSTMIAAGVPLPRGLATLAEQTENKKFKTVINSIEHDVESGQPLADAFGKYPDIFSDVFINMVRAGETGGILNEILLRLAMQVEKEAQIHSKIRSAMAYPVVILVITIVAFFGIMLFIMPKISKIITDLGGPDAHLPVYSRIMLQVSAFMQHNIIFIALALAIITFLFRRYIKTEKGRYQWHLLLLNVPIFGKIIAKVAIARFSRTFSSLMGSGVTVLEALEVTGKAVGNKVIQRELATISDEVKNGQSLGKQLMGAAYFPPIVGQMVAVGEETGKIDEILVKVADFYEQEVDAVIDGLASIIEPVMIVVLGGLVGLIAASVMGPIAGLSKNIGG